MDTTHLPPDFKEFLQSLNDRDVAYLLIGGYAVGYYGYVRATADMDVWIASTEENAKRITEALRDFGFDSPALKEALFLESGNIVRMGLPPFRIEVLTSIDGVDFMECEKHRVLDTIDGITVPLISLEHLKANKRASGRLKGLTDLEHLP